MILSLPQIIAMFSQINMASPCYFQASRPFHVPRAKKPMDCSSSRLVWLWTAFQRGKLGCILNPVSFETLCLEILLAIQLEKNMRGFLSKWKLEKCTPATSQKDDESAILSDLKFQHQIFMAYLVVSCGCFSQWESLRISAFPGYI